MASPTRARALQLVRQGRHDLAEPELRRALAEDPADADLHALLALTLVRTGRAEQALPEAEAAVGLAPDRPLAHYARADVLLGLKRLGAAVAAAREVLRLDPRYVSAWVKLAAALFDQQKYAEARAATDEALALEPTHVGALNLRALLLVQDGRRDEAAALLDGALAQAPEAAVSHANRGWTLLHQGDPHAALGAFREALRLDPNFEWARAGVVEAMKARNVVYRLLLRYYLWMGRLSRGRRWGVLIGGYLVAQLVPPLLLIYLPLVLLTWVGDPLFNALLLLDPFGRLVLSRDERVGAAAVGGCMGGGMLLGLAAFVAGSWPLAALGGVLFSLSIPASAVAVRPPGKRRWAAAAAGVLAAVGLGAAGAFLAGDAELAQGLAGFYLIGFFAFTIAF